MAHFSDNFFHVTRQFGYAVGLVFIRLCCQTVYFFLGYVFVEYQNYECLWGQHLDVKPGGSGQEIEVCKEWCASNQQCTAFVVSLSTCFFLGPGCEDDLYQAMGTWYLKKTTWG